jgi:L-ascorbate metabolism protein UlaG (beta-lactamase superfamily)
MEIYWLGHGCFRIRGREATVVTDPCPPTTGYKIGKVAADLVTISHSDDESNYRQAITGEPKFITGPGEYEISGVLITAVRTNPPDKTDRKNNNVAFVMDIDDVRVCHLGNIKQVPSGDDVEILSAADILLIPVGGRGALDSTAAAETVSRLEPKIVIPMRYRTETATGELETVDKFLKEMGVEAKSPEARLNATKSNLPAHTTIVVLEPRG